MYIGNGDYYNMLYYLQTACIIIAMIHGWVQPYKNVFLNGLDEVILLVLVLVINLNTFSFLSSVSSEFSVVLLLIPLLLICFIAIRKFVLIENTGSYITCVKEMKRIITKTGQMSGSYGLAVVTKLYMMVR